MSELGETISEVIEEAGESRLGTIVALLVALAATFVALAGVKDRNLTLGMTRAQTKAVDAWNQYQAKSMKQNLAEFAAGLSANPAVVEKMQAEAKRYAGEKEQIRKEAEALEKQSREANDHSEHALHPHHYLAISMTLLQIAIALASITVLTRKHWLLYGAAAAAFGGAVLGIIAWF